MESTDSILDIYFLDTKKLGDYIFLEKDIEENFKISYKKYIFLEDNIFDNFEPEKINMKLSYGLILDDIQKLEKIFEKYDFIQRYNISYLDENIKDNDFIDVRVSKLNSILDQTTNIISIQRNLESLKKYVDYEKQDEYKEFIEKLGKHRENIDKIIISSRIVDLKEEVERIKTIILDYSRIINKDVEFSVKGLKTNVDKYIFNKIKDHIINVFVNSIIYGIESKDERILYEKDKIGKLSLNFKQEFGDIVVEMLDDGQGIDEIEIYQRAVKSGIIDMNKNYTKDEILHLVFRPEMSLVNEKDENKERDLTLSNFYNTVEELNGEIKVESKKNEYTLITVKIPLDFILTETLIIKVGDVNYGIPFNIVEKTIKLERENFSYISGYTYYSFENEDYVVLRIPDKLISARKKLETYGIILNISGEKYIFLADYLGNIEELIPQKIVLNNKIYDSFAGGAILKNEEICLILNIKTIIKTKDYLRK